VIGHSVDLDVKWHYSCIYLVVKLEFQGLYPVGTLGFGVALLLYSISIQP
jgi:hypothetical protein